MGKLDSSSLLHVHLVLLFRSQLPTAAAKPVFSTGFPYFLSKSSTLSKDSALELAGFIVTGEKTSSKY